VIQRLADERTLDALDFSSVRDRVVSATRTQRGRSIASSLTPSTDFGAVREEQRRTAAARELIVAADLHVMPAIDTAPLTQGASLGRTLGASDLRAVGDALAAAAAAFNAVRESEALRPVVAGYTPLREVQRSLVDSIDERGVVLDRASPALGRIRRSLSQAQVDARDRVSAILRSAKYAKAIQDNVVTIREGRFVVPIKAEFSGEFPGIVHDTSSSGQTLFIEPLAALDSNNRLRTLRLDEEREVQRVLEELSHAVGTHAGAIEANIETLAVLDSIVAKGEVARSMDASVPELVDEPAIAIHNGRHPLLAARAVPQSLTLDDATRLLVISGPNMGGKTVALKMVGLFVSMAYCGMQLPAASVSVGRFDSLIADIGDEQSIVANASTFSAHLQRMREMLDGAGHRTLAIVDEIGGGTEPSAGAALAVAMLERLLESGAHAVVTTHATELKLFAHGTTGVTNASVRFDPLTFKPTFHLDAGTPGQSLAFPLARALGIDEEIVERAQRLLDNRERDYESALAELSMRTAELQQERDGLAEERAATLRELQSLERDRSKLDAERRSFGERADERMQQALREFVRELERRAAEREVHRPKVSNSQAALLAQTIDAMHADLGIRPPEPPAPEEGGFARDEPVRILSLGQDGSVVEDYGKTLLVAIGPMKTVVKRSDLRRRQMPQGGKRVQPAAQGSTKGGTARMQAASRSSAELDVRGKRFVEAEPLVERWIDEATLAAGGAPLRLIHGKGTGMLGRGLQEYLRTNPAVKSVRYGNEDEGSWGVTIVELQS
jgi:DNA mismatch repair protein MutS2